MSDELELTPEEALEVCGPDWSEMDEYARWRRGIVNPNVARKAFRANGLTVPKHWPPVVKSRAIERKDAA